MKQAVIMGAGIGLCMAMASQGVDLSSSSAQTDGFCEDGSVCHTHGDMTHSHDDTFHTHGDKTHSHASLPHAHGDVFHSHDSQIAGVSDPVAQALNQLPDDQAALLPDMIEETDTGSGNVEQARESRAPAAGLFSPLRAEPLQDASAGSSDDGAFVSPDLSARTVQASWGAKLGIWGDNDPAAEGADVVAMSAEDREAAEREVIVAAEDPAGNAGARAVVASNASTAREEGEQPGEEIVTAAISDQGDASSALPSAREIISEAPVGSSALADETPGEKGEIASVSDASDGATPPFAVAEVSGEDMLEIDNVELVSAILDATSIIDNSTLASLFELAYPPDGTTASAIYEMMLATRLFDGGLGYEDEFDPAAAQGSGNSFSDGDDGDGDDPLELAGLFGDVHSESRVPVLSLSLSPGAAEPFETLTEAVETAPGGTPASTLDIVSNALLGTAKPYPRQTSSSSSAARSSPSRVTSSRSGASARLDSRAANTFAVTSSMPSTSIPGMAPTSTSISASAARPSSTTVAPGTDRLDPAPVPLPAPVLLLLGGLAGLIGLRRVSRA